MLTARHQNETDAPAASDKTAEGGVFAALGSLGAVLASSCCILPLVLVVLGASGAWIGTLTALEPYQPYFLVATVALLGAGYWQVYFRRKGTCAPSAACGTPVSRRVTKGALWLATGLAILAATVNWWAPLFY